MKQIIEIEKADKLLIPFGYQAIPDGDAGNMVIVVPPEPSSGLIITSIWWFLIGYVVARFFH